MGLTARPKVRCPLFSRTGTTDGVTAKSSEREYDVNGHIILTGSGRIVTGNINGTWLNIDATYETPGEGWELRWKIVDWADTNSISQFQGLYLAVENTETNANATLRGAEITARDNNVGVGVLHGLHVNAYIKGAANSKTIGQVDGIQAQVEFDSGVGTRTVTNTSSALHAIIYTGGTITNVATKINGITVTVGDTTGASTTIANGLLMEDSSGHSGTCALTTGIYINIGCTDGILIAGACGDNAVEVSGTITDSVLQATGTYATGLTFGGTPTKIMAAGSYASPLTHQGSELVTIAATAAQTWALGIGVYIKTTGEDNYGFPICTLVESLNTTGTKTLQGGQFMAFLGTVGGSEAAILKTRGGDATAGMYAGWFKVGANSNCVANSGSRIAAIWVDNQCSGTISGEEYAIFVSCGASKVDAVIGLETTSSGWTNLLSFDETSYDQHPIMGLSVATNAGASTNCIRIDLNGTPYYIPIFDAAS